MGQVDRTGPIISPPYPEVTLDNFGFPVGGRLAARRAVFRPQQPKVTLTRPKMQKWPKIIFFTTYVEFFPGFGENNVESAIASFCLVFRAF